MFDYALVRVEVINAQEQLNYDFPSLVGYDRLPDPKLKIMVYGYPKDKNQKHYGPRNYFSMFGETGRLNDIDVNFIKYSISTNQGQSGCPIFLINEKEGEKVKFEIIGTHRGTDPKWDPKTKKLKYNEAVNVRNMVDDLKKWAPSLNIELR